MSLCSLFHFLAVRAILSLQAPTRAEYIRKGYSLFEYTQKVNASDKDVILNRYLSVGWGLKRILGCGDQPIELVLIWAKNSPPVFPDLSNLH